MKDIFTIKEITDGTGLTRQRIHQLINSRKIPVIRENKHILVKWQDLLKVTDNASMLNFLKDTLDNERKFLEKVHDYQQENEKAIQYAKAIEYAKILLEGDPGINNRDSERWKQWIKASLFFDSLGQIRNPTAEVDSEKPLE